ncbi:MAG TPA: GNAT family N-acetyltransferase [Gemmatimonadaceae bacterium]|nr:GNAT family N-acetyltransferase [Gemmatimonadaceae bacterium]
MSDHAGRVSGPYMITPDDLTALNTLFSDAFSERYRRDGMAGVRVPPLNPAIWRFAIEGAGAGAMLWRDSAGRIAAFNLAHVSGTEGWMGPLAVRDEVQGRGVGRTIVRAGIDHLKAAGCRIIGLETMPRTMDNIGFYAGLGFAPGALTITLTLEPSSATDVRPTLLSELGQRARASMIAECASLADHVRAGADYSREITLSLRHGLGDVLVMRAADGALEGFALYHDVPLVEGRSREEMRVLKLVLADPASLPRMADLLAAHARRCGTQRAALRLQGEYRAALRTLVARGARVRWTDLRMTLSGYDEPAPSRGLALSNWEI